MENIPTVRSVAIGIWMHADRNENEKITDFSLFRAYVL